MLQYRYLYVTVRNKITGRTAVEIAASLERRMDAAGAGSGPLPTVRTLAERLGVSPTTVASAYKLLKTRGLVAGHGRLGTRVVQTPLATTAGPETLVPAGAIDLATGNPDPALLPPLESALRTIDSRPVMYGGAGADRALAAYAAAEFEADGIAAPAIAPTSGALDAIERILREYLRAGDRVAVEDPSFSGILDLVSASAFAPTPFAVDEWGPRPDAFADALGKGSRAVIITPRAQNPTGAAITAERAAELGRILRRFPDVVLIENDYAAPVAGAAAVSLARPGRMPWAVVRSTSKFLGPDVRVAVVAGDERTLARVVRRQALGARWVSHLLQRLALALWADPANGRRFARAAELYAARRTALRAALAAHGIQSYGESGFNVWVPVPGESAVVQALAARGWAVAAGERFRLRSPPAIRVTTSTLDPADAVRLAAALAAVLRPSPRPLA
jgi:DNA-binding transcriptional MocR family regulator